MGKKVTIEVDERFVSTVQRALALAVEMEQLALSAPDGQVLHDCEQVVIELGRTFQAQTLQQAVTRRIEVAEKKGRRSAFVAADAKKRIVAANPDN